MYAHYLTFFLIQTRAETALSLSVNWPTNSGHILPKKNKIWYKKEKVCAKEIVGSCAAWNCFAKQVGHGML